MKILLGRLKGTIPDESYADLSKMLDEIEVSVTTEAAEQELGKLPLKK